MIRKKKKFVEDSRANEETESSIFMPTIFEINCGTKLIHDYSSDKGSNELYGFSYTLISN